MPLDAVSASRPQHYWPTEQLYAFTLQMAARGLCVSASMMLGDRAYALAQLHHAEALNDAELHALAHCLQNYFEAPVCPSAPRMN